MLKGSPRPIKSTCKFFWRWISSPILRNLIRNPPLNGEALKLQIGCGGLPLPGWINTDVAPSRPNVYFLDARRRLPFKDSTWDIVFSEHLIEHISYEAGAQMLRECFRILKPAGRIRLSTPDLAKILSLYFVNDEEHQFYKKRTLNLENLPRFPKSEAFIINHFMRAWGHLFIYDEATLTDSLRRAGFINILRTPVGQSHDPNLTAIEQHGRSIGEEANAFESMVLEAEKP